MLRNAQLFQSSEAQKRSNIEEREGYIQEIKSKDTAIAGLEQSLQDMTADLATKQQRVGFMGWIQKWTIHLNLHSIIACFPF